MEKVTQAEFISNLTPGFKAKLGCVVFKEGTSLIDVYEQENGNAVIPCCQLLSQKIPTCALKA